MKPYLILFLVYLYNPVLGLTQESDAISCSDGIDNDNDGSIDCADVDCSNLPNEGCSVCGDGISFADILIEYQSGCPQIDPEPLGILGVADFTGGLEDEFQMVFLGQGGFVKVGFTNNLLTNSATSDADLFVFEIGIDVEATTLAVRPADDFTLQQLQQLGFPDFNSDGFYEVGDISGSTTGFDLDAVLPSYPAGVLRFDAVEIRDIEDGDCSNIVPGADIDAICALSTIPIDCNGIENGTAVVDACGDCLEPNDPMFNQSCADCAGSPNGVAVIDQCGVCLVPDDPEFDQRCIDCAGILNGTFEIDNCGFCLAPDDPTFNTFCSDGFPIYIPNAIAPDSDNANQRLQIFFNPLLNGQVIQYAIYSRWGELLYEAKDFPLTEDGPWWDGAFRGQPLNPGHFVYHIQIQLTNGPVVEFSNGFQLLR